jgi:predicted nucleic acid-binding Zn ribbon protein
MPIYVYYCEECKRTMEVKQKITDPVLQYHGDMTEGHLYLEEPCDGKVKRIIQLVNVKVKSGTPKFFKK